MTLITFGMDAHKQPVVKSAHASWPSWTSCKSSMFGLPCERSSSYVLDLFVTLAEMLLLVVRNKHLLGNASEKFKCHKLAMLD